MPRGQDNEYLNAGNALLNAFKEAAGPHHNASAGTTGKVAKLKVKEFDHHGVKVRGVAPTEAIEKNELLLAIPQFLRPPRQELLEPRFETTLAALKGIIDPTKLGLWLAEKRAGLHKSKGSGDKSTEGVWEAYIRHLPTFAELQASGIPLLQRQEVLKSLKPLPPQVAIISEYVSEMHKSIYSDVKSYNALRGDRPELSFGDALWGHAVADSRAFNCNGITLAPVGDMLNSSSDPNVRVVCEDSALGGSAVTYRATRPIERGTELTIKYRGGFGDPGDATTQKLATEAELAKFPGGLGTLDLMKYGTAHSVSKFLWPQEACGKIQQANFRQSRHKLHQAIADLADKSCSHASKSMSASPPNASEKSPNLHESRLPLDPAFLALLRTPASSVPMPHQWRRRGDCGANFL